MPNTAFTSKFKKISLESLRSGKINPPLYSRALEIKSKFIFNKAEPYIVGKKILDIGTGLGGFAAHLSLKGFDVESIDIADSSFFKEFPSKIYDGENFPFKDKEFDTAFLVHVLHHCKDRMRVLREALRTSKRVIFVEDTYRNGVEWFVGSIIDMAGNGEYYFHEYSTPEEWRQILGEEGCKIIHEESYSRFTYHLFYGRYVLFVVEKK